MGEAEQRGTELDVGGHGGGCGGVGLEGMGQRLEKAVEGELRHAE